MNSHDNKINSTFYFEKWKKQDGNCEKTIEDWLVEMAKIGTLAKQYQELDKQNKEQIQATFANGFKCSVKGYNVSYTCSEDLFWTEELKEKESQAILKKIAELQQELKEIKNKATGEFYKEGRKAISFNYKK
jgi:hypothetical protein